MNIDITTPALLFPAITLLLLAYTNRFLALATLIRSLHKKYLEFPEQKLLLNQIQNLKRRVSYIKWMQTFGVVSFLFCVISMILVFTDNAGTGNITFGISLASLLLSLVFSLMELQISTKALGMELKDME